MKIRIFYTKIEVGNIDISSATSKAVFRRNYLKLKLDCFDRLKCVLGGLHRFCHMSTPQLNTVNLLAGIQYEF